MSFVELLIESEWREHEPFTFRKANWLIVFGTSAWLEVGTDKTPRLFDVPVPHDGGEQWTLSLINHLCKTDDELQRITQAWKWTKSA